MGTKLLNRDSLLKKEELKKEKVELNDGEFVYVKQMSGRERDAFEKSLLLEGKDEKGNTTYERTLDNFRTKLAVLTLCDENGERILNYEDHVVLNNNMAAETLDKIVEVANRLNAIKKEDKDTLIKNSNADQKDNSSSGSADKLE
jgi:gamma-glutamyltranspeptidase